MLDLTTLEYDKLLGGGKITNAYTIKVKYASNTAQEKVKKSGGEVIIPAQKNITKTEEKTEEKPEKKTEEKTVTNNDG